MPTAIGRAFRHAFASSPTTPTLVTPADAPTSVFDLADPRWRGQVAIADPRFGSTSFHVAALYAAAGDERMDAFFRQLKANDVKIVDGNSVVRDLVARGEVKIGLTDTDDVNVAIEDGQPIAMVLPDAAGLGVPVMPNMVSLVANAPHVEEGQRLIDYLLSRDVEEQLARSAAVQIPLHAGVPGPRNIPAIDTFRPMTLDFTRAAQRVEDVTGGSLASSAHSRSRREGARTMWGWRSSRTVCIGLASCPFRRELRTASRSFLHARRFAARRPQSHTRRSTMGASGQLRRPRPRLRRSGDRAWRAPWACCSRGRRFPTGRCCGSPLPHPCSCPPMWWRSRGPIWRRAAGRSAVVGTIALAAWTYSLPAGAGARPGCCIPFSMLATEVALRRIDGRLEEAALMVAAPGACSGASRCPSPAPGIMAAALVIFVLAVSEFGVPGVCGSVCTRPRSSRPSPRSTTPAGSRRAGPTLLLCLVVAAVVAALFGIAS